LKPGKSGIVAESEEERGTPLDTPETGGGQEPEFERDAR
jgi:hypothetical protein